MDPTAPTTTAPEAAPAGDTKAPGEDIFDVILEGAEKPVRIPASKLPMDKINPHLAKLRADADRKLSEVDRRSKELTTREGRTSAIERLAASVKENPDTLEALATELGMTPEQLDALSEKRIAQRIRSQVQAEEEKTDPNKKTAREEREELDRMRRENEDLKTKQAKEAKGAVKARVEGAIMSAMDKLPVGLRGPQAAQEMVAFIRASLEEASEKLGRQATIDDLSITIDDLAKNARESLRGHARTVYDGDEEIEFTDAQLKRAEAIIAKRAAAKHPSANGNNGKGNGAPPRAKQQGDASSVLLKLLKM